MIDAFGRFEEMGCTRLELMTVGNVDEAIEGLAPVVETFRPA
jgi:hypothetical protein